MDWSSFEFSPLRLTPEIVDKARAFLGKDCVLHRGDEVPQSTKQFFAEPFDNATLVMEAPGVHLAFTNSHATLSFDDSASDRALAIQQYLGPQRPFLSPALLPLVLACVLSTALAFQQASQLALILVTLGGVVGAGLVMLFLKRRAQAGTKVEDKGEEVQVSMAVDSPSWQNLAELAAVFGSGDVAIDAVHTHRDGAHFRVYREGLELRLWKDRALLVYSSPVPHLEKLVKLVHAGARPLRFFTHDDLSLMLGLVFPVLAHFAAPEEHHQTALMISALPWLGYAIWVLRNRMHRWTVFVS